MVCLSLLIKMKKALSILLLIPIGILLLGSKNIDTNTESTNLENAYTLDLKNSKILWNIKTSRGGNNGELLIKSGTFSEENKNIKAADILMDMTAIQIRSIPPGIVNMKAVTILNTESFFDVAKFPTSRLEITKTIRKSESSFEVLGFLTIKGRRNAIRFLMEGQFADGHFEGTSKNIIVNRGLYNIRYTTDNNTDKDFDAKVEDAIDESFTIDVFIVADKELVIKN